MGCFFGFGIFPIYFPSKNSKFLSIFGGGFSLPAAARAFALVGRGEAKKRPSNQGQPLKTNSSNQINYPHFECPQFLHFKQPSSKIIPSGSPHSPHL